MPIPQNNKTIDRKSARTVVYDTIKDWIIDGTLRPGEKIIDSEISEYFSVSRTPVREALQLLSEQELVEIIPSKGTRVTPINIQDLRSVYITLSCIHSNALKFAFHKITPKVIDKLDKINQDMFKAIKERDFQKLSEIDNCFHNVFLELADNPYFISFNDQLLAHAMRVENLNFQFSVPSSKSVDEHCKIVEALKNNNLDDAINLMENNWLRFIEIDLESYNK